MTDSRKVSRTTKIYGGPTFTKLEEQKTTELNFSQVPFLIQLELKSRNSYRSSDEIEVGSIKKKVVTTYSIAERRK